jgi:hypothetical protein
MNIDPRMMGLLAAAGAGLEASGPSRMPVSTGQVISRGLLSGVNAYQGAQDRELKQGLLGMQMNGMQMDMDAKRRALEAQTNFSTSLDPQQRALFNANPSAYLTHHFKQQEPYNLRQGDKRIGANGQVIAENAKPINLHFTDTGDSIQPMDPTTGAPVGSAIPKKMTPGEGAKLGWQQFQWQNLSPYQQQQLSNDRTGLGLRAQGLNLDRQKFDFERDPTAQGGISQARAAGKEFGEAQSQAQIALPQAIAKATHATDLIDQMIGDLKIDKNGNLMAPMRGGKKAHPGFSVGVGASAQPFAQHIPGTDKAGFQAILDQVKGGAFLQAFESLKGGGAITEMEGRKATEAITRMSTAQSEVEFVKAAREFQDSIRGGLERSRQRAGRRASDSAGGVLRFDAQGNPI